MKVLITGGAGFVGGHLAYRLAQSGVEVHLLDNFQRGISDPFLASLLRESRVRLIEADLRRTETLEQLDPDYTHIYHLAAIIGVRHVLEHPYEVLAENAKMTVNAIELGRRQKQLKRLLFASTSEVYAGSLLHLDMPIPTPESTPIALTELCHPRTSYMLSKLYGEALCAHSGLPVTSVRLHNVYGPRMGLSHVIPELLFKVWSAEEGQSVEVFNPSHKRTFCYVDDAAAMIRAVAESPAAEGRTVNIGNQSPEIAIGELARIVVATVGRNVTLVWRDQSVGSPARRCPDTSLLANLTGVQGKHSVEEGVALTYRWYEKHVFRDGGKSAV